MTINERQVGNATILDLKGPLKLGSPVESLRSRLQAVLGAGAKNLALNLSEVPDVDSSGIGVLMLVYTSTKKAGGRCRFFAVPPRVAQVLKLVRLDRVLEMVEDEASALAGF